MKKLSFIAGFAVLLWTVLLACSKEKTTPDEPEMEEDPITTFFKGEVRPSESLPCFNGAYYRKVVSSKDKWLGIGGTVVLPQIAFDENRKNPNKPGQYLDNPSVYLGGNMNGQETDIGLTWEVIRDENGNVTADRRAFRPFLRRTGYSATGQQAAYENAPAESQYYWYPGDEVELSIQVLENKKIRLVVAGEGKRFERDFDCDGYNLSSVGEFKRVNAIDQVANEGKPVQPTQTEVSGAEWKETHYFRLYEGEVVEAPVHSHRFTDMRCPGRNHFRVTAGDEGQLIGAETIDISGAGF